MLFPDSNHVPAPRQYTDRREVFDATEACHLINQGWKLVGLVTVSRWSSGYHSESTTYTLGLPRPDVLASAA